MAGCDGSSECQAELLGYVVGASLTHIRQELLNTHDATSTAIHAENRTAILQLWHKSVGWQHASESNTEQKESLLKPKVIEWRMNIGRAGWELKENMSHECLNAFRKYAGMELNDKLPAKKHLSRKKEKFCGHFCCNPLRAPISSFTTSPTWATQPSPTFTSDRRHSGGLCRSNLWVPRLSPC